MDVKPLIDLNGNVWCYACGKCLKIHDQNFTTLFRIQRDNLISPDQKFVEESHAKASKCCSCEKCGAFADETYSIFPRVCKKCKPLADAERKLQDQKLEQDRLRRESVIEESLKLCLDRDDAETLKDTMSYLSEEYWCAGWIAGLEYTLWEAVENFRSGKSEKSLSKKAMLGRSFNKTDGRKLDRLSKRSGGWWMWDDTEHTQIFIAASEWEKIYKEKNKK